MELSILRRFALPPTLFHKRSIRPPTSTSYHCGLIPSSQKPKQLCPPRAISKETNIREYNSTAAKTFGSNYYVNPKVFVSSWSPEHEVKRHFCTTADHDVDDEYNAWFEAFSTEKNLHRSHKSYVLPKEKKRDNPISANVLADDLVEREKFKNIDQEHSRRLLKEVSDQWKTHGPDLDLSQGISKKELVSAVQHLNRKTPPGPDNIYPGDILDHDEETMIWLLNFFSSCLQHHKIPKVWRRATVVAVPMPRSPRDDAKSYRYLSFLCIPRKIFEYIIYARIKAYLLPPDFRQGPSALCKAIWSTQDIEEAFEAKKKVGAVCVTLTDAFNTVWHPGLTSKLLRVLPDKHMVHMIMELVSNPCFILKAFNQQSRLRHLKNGLHQGSILSPLLFSIYIHDLPSTSSSIYGHGNNLALIQTRECWNDVEMRLNEDMAMLSSYFIKWRLNLSQTKTVSASFHLVNKEANRELNVKINESCLPHDRTPTCVGVKLDRSRTYRQFVEGMCEKLISRISCLRNLVDTGWIQNFETLHTLVLALVYHPVEYFAPIWSSSVHSHRVDKVLEDAMRLLTGFPGAAHKDYLPMLSNIKPAELCRSWATTARIQQAANQRRLKSRRLLYEPEKNPPLPTLHTSVHALLECLVCQSPHGIYELIELDEVTIKWLVDGCPDIWHQTKKTTHK